MQLQDVIIYCSAKKDITREFPFDDDTLVLKVMGKMFVLIQLNPPYSMNLECDPIFAIALRRKYKDIHAGYHMNIKHWNTIDLNANVPKGEFYDMIDVSYKLVVNGLNRAQCEALERL